MTTSGNTVGPKLGRHEMAKSGGSGGDWTAKPRPCSSPWLRLPLHVEDGALAMCSNNSRARFCASSPALNSAVRKCRRPRGHWVQWCSKLANECNSTHPQTFAYSAAANSLGRHLLLSLSPAATASTAYCPSSFGELPLNALPLGLTSQARPDANWLAQR